MKKATISLNDLIKKAPSSKTQTIKPLMKSYTKAATSFITKNFSEKTTGVKVEQNQSKTEVKPEQNQSKTGVKTGVKVEQNQSKTEVKPQPVISKVEYKPEYNKSKSRVKVEQNLVFSTLVGLQKELVIILFDACQRNGTLETPKITIDFLANKVLNPQISIKKALQIVEKKGFLIRKMFKNGRGGWTIYKLPKTVYQEILQIDNQAKLRQNWSKTGVKVEHKPEYKPEYPTPSSSSSFNYKKTTTTDENKRPSRLVCISELLREVGFSQSHVAQVQEKWPKAANKLQESLEALEHDIRKVGLDSFKNQKRIGNLVGWFMGAMKSGGYISTCPDFLTDEEKGEREMLDIIEKVKREREERDAKIKDFLFEEWLKTKTEQELIKLAQPVNEYMDAFHKAMLEGYFEKNVMDEFKKKFKGNLKVSPSVDEPNPEKNLSQSNDKKIKRRPKSVKEASFYLDLAEGH